MATLFDPWDVESAGANVVTNVPIVTPDDPAGEVRSRLLGRRYDSATDLAVCVEGRLLGLLRLEDVLAAPDKTPVRDLMTSDCICAREDDDVEEIASKMSEAQVRRLPVIDSSEKLCGIVSLGDLSRETDNDTAGQALEGVSQPGGQHQQ